MNAKRWAAVLVGLASLVLLVAVVAQVFLETYVARGGPGNLVSSDVGSFPPDYSSDRCYWATVDGGHTEVPCP